MKEKPNPLAGIVDAMKAHDNRLARNEPKPVLAQVQPVVSLTKVAVTPVQTVATVEKPRRASDASAVRTQGRLPRQAPQQH